MKVLKPLTLSVLTRPFQARGERRLGVHVMAMVPLLGPSSLCGEQELWERVPRALGEMPVLEEGVPKSRAEALLAGHAYAPGGEATTCPVEWSLGGIHRRASVIGDRVWEREVPSAPAPFSSMPLTWERAFGGEGFKDNPLGRGHAPTDVDGVSVHRLPNVEHPDRLIRSLQDRPPPLGFGGIDLRWPTRAQHRGTYDNAWLESRFPGFADDLDWRHWNLALPEQQQDDAFRGDESFVLRNLHPTHPEIRGQLPGLSARAFIVRGDPLGEADLGGPMEEVATRLMTVWLLPDEERAVLIYSGSTQVEEDDARDVRLLMVAAEDAPRERAHYEAVRDRRIDKDRASIEALMDADLVPEALLSPLPTALPGLESEGHFTANQRRARALRVDEAKALADQHGTSLEALGMDFGEDPADAAVPDLRDIPALLKETEEKIASMKADAERDAAKRQEDVRALGDRLGIDLSSILDDRDGPTGPPAFTAERERDKLRDVVERARSAGSPQPELEAQLDDEAQFATWKADERKLRDLYRASAHHQSPASERPENAALREELSRAAKEGTPIRERDLTGASLAGLELAGLDLSGCLLESADLSGANLSGACLEQAVLAHANLRGANLSGATLTGANLGRACLDDADLSDVDLKGATLLHTEFRGASLRRASFHETWLMHTVMAGADLSAAEGRELFWVEVDLTGARLLGAVLSKSTFVDCRLGEVDASDARLDAANFVTCSFDRAVLARVHAPELRWVHGVSAEGVDLRYADLTRANLRGVQFGEADLSGATLDGADLSESTLDGANLYGCRARGSRWMRTSLRGAVLMKADLMEASFMNADLRGVDLRDSSLFAADLALIVGDAETRMDGADRDRLRVRPMRSSS
ncbi:MAG: DUF2169 domain-containing protein [Sandaracinaceae bacterium]